MSTRTDLARQLGEQWEHFRTPQGWTFEQYWWAVLWGAPFYAIGGWVFTLLAWPFRRRGSGRPAGGPGPGSTSNP